MLTEASCVDYILDSSALLNNERFSFTPPHRYFMTNACFSELKSFSPKLLAENALSQKTLALRDPDAAALEELETALLRIGDTRLSAPDQSLLALAIAFREKGVRATVVSDDYSVQNACRHLRIPFEGSVQGRIKRARTWQK